MSVAGPIRFVNADVLGGGRELCVRDGVVVAQADDGAVVDCGGKLLAPAIVDLGVFAIDRAAFRAGGIARVGLMPDQSPPLDHPGPVQRASLIGKPDLWIHPLAAATRGLEGRELAEIASCLQAGARADLEKLAELTQDGITLIQEGRALHMLYDIGFGTAAKASARAEKLLGVATNRSAKVITEIAAKWC